MNELFNLRLYQKRIYRYCLYMGSFTSLKNRQQNKYFTKTAMLKSKVHGSIDGKQCYLTDEAYVVTSPFTAQNKVIEDDDTSKGQNYIYNDEMTMGTDASTKASAMQQKSSLPSLNHLPEMSSESEWEEMAQFPGLFLL